MDWQSLLVGHRQAKYNYPEGTDNRLEMQTAAGKLHSDLAHGMKLVQWHWGFAGMLLRWL